MRTIEDALHEFGGKWKYEHRDQLWVCTKQTTEFSEGCFCYASTGQMELDGKIKAHPHWNFVCSKAEFEQAAKRQGGEG